MIKFNDGYGALICDRCRVIIQQPYDMRKEQVEVFCEKCKKIKASEGIKQVIVMRTKYPDGKGGFFSMRKGKMVAQGAHASMAVFFDRMEKLQCLQAVNGNWGEGAYVCNVTPEMGLWKEGAFTKICVSVDSEEALLKIYNSAVQVDIPCALIEDRGLTEFKGEKTLTCCAIGPDRSEKIDLITGELPLL